MSIKIVRGSAGDFKTDPNGQGPKINQNSSSSAAQAAVIAASRSGVASSEAVNVSVRSRSISSGERIKDSREAKDVADKVAGKIRDEDGALGAHDGLTATNSREHFAQ